MPHNDEDCMSNNFFISDISKITGIPQKTIRNWEKFLGPVDRLPCGKMKYRYYTKKQLNLIKKAKEFIDEGYCLKVAFQKANTYLLEI